MTMSGSQSTDKRTYVELSADVTMGILSSSSADSVLCSIRHAHKGVSGAMLH